MKPFARILAATDLSAPSRHAVERGFRIAADFGSEYTVVHAFDTESPDALFGLLGERAPEVRARIEAAALASLRDLLADTERNCGVTATPEVLEGAAIDIVLRKAGELDAGLLLLGARGESFLRHALLGSTASRLLRKSTRRPVLVVKQRPHERYRHVLVAVDFSPASAQAIRLAQRLAPSATLVLFHAFELPYEGKLVFAGVDEGIIRQYVQTAAEACRKKLLRLAEDEGLPADGHFVVVRHGDPSQQIVATEQERDIDLIVLGKHGMHLTEELLLGSVTKHVLAESQCDVLVVGDSAPD